MADQFTEKITVKDEWENNGERFRLVDKGAGPMELQTINPHTNDVDWKPERDHYVHGVLCARIVELANATGHGRGTPRTVDPIVGTGGQDEG